MNDREYLLGIDVGTSGCKALLVDTAGAVAAEATVEYPLDMPRPLWSQQNPHDWHKAAIRAIRDVLERAAVAGKCVRAVGLTGQMHGLVLLDARGDVLRPAILWNDQRTAAQCDEITRRVGPQRVIELTGNPVLTGFTAPKVLWVRQNEPDTFSRVAHILLPKDYVRYRLTGRHCGDVSDASGTSLFDVGRRAWSDEMLAALDIPRSWLPEVSESPVASATLSAQAASETGLEPGTPIVAGAGDQAAQAVGTGITDEGPVSVTLGTSGVVFAASRSYRVEPAGLLHAFCHAVPGMWHLMGVMLAAGGSFEWLCDTFGSCVGAAAGGSAAAEKLLELAGRAEPRCDGVIFLPYLTGERTPHADPLARGVFFGLTARTRLEHLARSVVEGVSFGLRDSFELIRGLGTKLQDVRVSGGGARSGLWRQILADVLNTPIRTVNTTQGAAYGAALLAGVGAGVWPTVADAAAAAVRVTGTTSPGPAAAAYEPWYERFRALYPALRDHFAFSEPRP